MKLDNEFTVGVPIEQAWAVLTDLELIAPCMPGAQLTGVTDGVYSGKVKIKVGPVTAEYAGTAQFSVKEETTYRAVIDARGRDSRGNGNATAVISAQLEPAGESAAGASTRVSVSTDLTIAGRIAQFGSGMIKEVSAKLLGQFVTCLEGKLSAGAVSGAASTADTARTASDGGQAPASVAASSGAVGNAESTSEATSSTPASAAGAAASGQDPEPAALDLMSVAGASIYKRLVPLVVGLIVLAIVIYLLVR